MYKYDKSVGLVTVASAINNNLALLDVDEHLNADMLASVHEGFVNVVPTINHATRRSKYVALNSGSVRGSGLVKQVKWLKIKGETVFVVLSTNGIQIYDAEVTEVRFYHCCKDRGDNNEYTNGACVVKYDRLCVGTSNGVIIVFTPNENNTQFDIADRLYAHDDAITLLDGSENFMISSSKDTACLWTVQKEEFRIVRRISVLGLIGSPTSLKLSSCIAFVGYDSGELCVFDLTDEDFVIRIVAHRLEVSALDFSPLKFRLITASMDCFVKIWHFNQERDEVTCIFSLANQLGPVCGAGFLNLNCTEFCIVSANQVAVRIYVEDNVTDMMKKIL